MKYDLKRARLIKMVHIAANELGLLDPKHHATDPDDEYHLLLRQWNRAGTRQPVTSSTEMNVGQLEELYRHMKRLGFRVRRNEAHPHPPIKSFEGRPGPLPEGEGEWKKYESSVKGLREEICDLARARFGEAWELPLNNFCRRFGVERWQWLDVSHGKEVKGALLRLQRDDGRGSMDVKNNEETPF